MTRLTRWRRRRIRGARYPGDGPLTGRRERETCYNGWDVADAITDLGFLRPDSQTLIQQPHVHMEERKMWKLDRLRGNKLGSPLGAFRALTPEQLDAATAEYRKGFKINACS